MQSKQLAPLVGLVLACSSEAPEPPPASSESAGSNPIGVAGGGSASAQAGMSSKNPGGAPSVAGGAAPAGGVGGSSAAGAITGGGPSPGGSSTTGGSAASGAGGSAGGAGMGGASANVGQALDGLRIDAPCAGSPAATDGETCDHSVLTNNTFQSRKEVSITGSAGTIYDVTLRIRGVVEPTSVNGGTRPDKSTIVYKNAMWRKVPYTIGGSVKTPDYQAWRLSVAEPAQDYFLNDYQNTAHHVFELDYQVTIQMAGSTKITLDVTDSNEREIVNYEQYAPDGVDGSLNLGQFVQLNVISAQPR